VVLADSGQEAIRLARDHTFDLILMDVRMPEMDGLEATRLIRALPAPHCDVRVIALTACAFSDQVAECQAAGMDGHVSKPVDYKSLIKVVEETTGCERQAAEAKPHFDRAILDQTLGFMTAEDGTRHLFPLRERLVEILSLLEGQASPNELANAGHALVSAAGMFGFAALSALARVFEHAAAKSSPQTGRIGKQLAEETRAALETLDGLAAHAEKQPA
jgi:CheY-like chemotaxis protein